MRSDERRVDFAKDTPFYLVALLRNINTSNTLLKSKIMSVAEAFHYHGKQPREPMKGVIQFSKSPQRKYAGGMPSPTRLAGAKIVDARSFVASPEKPALYTDYQLSFQQFEQEVASLRHEIRNLQLEYDLAVKSGSLGKNRSAFSSQARYWQCELQRLLQDHQGRQAQIPAEDIIYTRRAVDVANHLLGLQSQLVTLDLVNVQESTSCRTLTNRSYPQLENSQGKKYCNKVTQVYDRTNDVHNKKYSLF